MLMNTEHDHRILNRHILDKKKISTCLFFYYNLLSIVCIIFVFYVILMWEWTSGRARSIQLYLYSIDRVYYNFVCRESNAVCAHIIRLSNQYLLDTTRILYIIANDKSVGAMIASDVYLRILQIIFELF